MNYCSMTDAELRGLEILLKLEFNSVYGNKYVQHDPFEYYARLREIRAEQKKRQEWKK